MKTQRGSAGEGGWSTILLIYSYGCIAAFSFGKVIAVAHDLGLYFGVSTGQIGWLISAPSGVGALTAIIAGWTADRLGDKRVLLTGALTSMCANLACYFSHGYGVLVASRVLEGCGVVALLLGGSAMMGRSIGGKRRNSALALWATCMPLGVGMAQVVSSVFAGTPAWRLVFLLHAALGLGAALAVRYLPAQADTQATRGSRPSLRIAGMGRGPYRLGLAFGLMTIAQFGIATSFTSYLIAHFGMAPSSAAIVGAFGAPMGILGSLLAGVTVNRGYPRFTIALFACVGAVAAAAMMLVVAMPAAAVAAMMVYIASGGMFFGLIMTIVPLVAPSPDRIGMANGITNQIGQVGFLLGPPIMFATLSFNSSVVAIGAIAMLTLAALVALPLPRQHDATDTSTPRLWGVQRRGPR